MTQQKRSSKLLANPAAKLITAAVVALFAAAALGAAPQDSGDRVNPDGAKIKAFEDRLEQYVAMKKKLEAGVPAAQPSDRTSGLEVRQKTMADRLRAARQGAKPGDLVGDVAPLIKATIQKDAQNRGVRDAYAAMQEVPPQNPPAVNAPYPQKAALATVPPLILINLPRLPDGLEYRFMGRDLILRDRDANLIVDFVSNAVPAFKK